MMRPGTWQELSLARPLRIFLFTDSSTRSLTREQRTRSMPLNRGTQKQIAQRFKGNLDYFRKPHYWRRLRLWTILLVCIIGVATMAFFFIAGPESIYNPGAISQHHAAFANDCNKCHEPPRQSLAGATLKFSNEGIDSRCVQCHKSHSFHQPNVVHER